MSLPKKKIGIFAFFLLTVFTITLKTYFSYYVDFSLGVKGLVQNLILLMNPYSLIALVLSVFLFFKGKKAFWFIFIGGFLLSFLLYANVVYFRFFSDFLTFSTLNQAGNVESMGGALGASSSKIIVYSGGNWWKISSICLPLRSKRRFFIWKPGSLEIVNITLIQKLAATTLNGFPIQVSLEREDFTSFTQ